MCGLVGFFSKHEISKNLINNMILSLNHRGPDDSGYYLDSNLNLFLGHTRLSILDITKNASQPIISNSGRYIMIFNGEIYNFKQIRKNLNDQYNITWKSSGDTEVLLNAFDKLGFQTTIKIIEGMYAIVVYDKKLEKLYLIRDKFGEKPLYFGNSNGKFYFASELKAITTDTNFKKKINKLSVKYLMSYNYVPSPLSIYENIFKLKHGHFIEINLKNHNFDQNIFTQNKYYENKTNIDKNLNDISLNKKILKNLLFQSVENKIESDVEVGSFLSSGIDSSTITAIMTKVSKKKIKTFSLGYDDPYFDESNNSIKIANYLGTDHQNIKFNLNNVTEFITNISKTFCEPFSDSSQIPTLYLSKETSNFVKVCFSGDGGDELFGGYNRYINYKLMYDIYKNKMSFQKTFINLIALRKFDFLINLILKSNKFFPTNFQIHNIIQKSENIAYSLTKENIFQKYLATNQHWKMDDFIKDDIEENDLFKENWNNNLNYLDKIMLFDLNTYLPDDLLVKVDRSSMAYGLEIRNPFLDENIKNFALTIPSEQKINNSRGKIILRSLLNDLIPKNLITQKKRGFLFPVKSVLNNQLKNWAENLLSEDNINSSGLFDYKKIANEWNLLKSGKIVNEYKIWDYLIFQDWYQKNF